MHCAVSLSQFLSIIIIGRLARTRPVSGDSRWLRIAPTRHAHTHTHIHTFPTLTLHQFCYLDSRCVYFLYTRKIRLARATMIGCHAPSIAPLWPMNAQWLGAVSTTRFLAVSSLAVPSSTCSYALAYFLPSDPLARWSPLFSLLCFRPSDCTIERARWHFLRLSATASIAGWSRGVIT